MSGFFVASALLLLALSCSQVDGVHRPTPSPEYVKACDEAHCGPGTRCLKDSRKYATCVCDNYCGGMAKPFCGSDGKTYESECELNYAACKSSGQIRLRREGRCDDGP